MDVQTNLGFHSLHMRQSPFMRDEANTEGYIVQMQKCITILFIVAKEEKITSIYVYQSIFPISTADSNRTRHA